MARTPASYYVKFDTYWQHSPDRFAGPFASRDDAQAAIDAALNDPQSKAVMYGQHATDIKHGVRIYGILSRSEARRDGLRLDWDAEQNCIGKRIPVSTDDLFELEQVLP